MSGGDILREVDEALRVEKMNRFLKEHGKTLAVFVAALILGTAVQTGWSSYRHHQAEVSTSHFVDALKEKDPLASLQKLSAEKNGSGSALAGLSAASLAVSKQDWAGAITLYEQVTANKTAPQTYKDLALVQMASLKIDHDDKATAADLQKLIAPVIKDKNSAWNSRAVFIAALIKANKSGDYKAARDDLQTLLSDPTLPPSFAAQVKALDDVYKIKGAAAK